MNFYLSILACDNYVDVNVLQVNSHKLSFIKANAILLFKRSYYEDKANDCLEVVLYKEHQITWPNELRADQQVLTIKGARTALNCW